MGKQKMESYVVQYLCCFGEWVDDFETKGIDKAHDYINKEEKENENTIYRIIERKDTICE